MDLYDEYIKQKQQQLTFMVQQNGFLKKANEPMINWNRL